MLWIQSCNQYIYLQLKNYAWTVFSLRAPLSNLWLKSCKCAAIFTKITLLLVYITRMRQYQQRAHSDFLGFFIMSKYERDKHQVWERVPEALPLSVIWDPNNFIKQANEDLICIKSLPKKKITVQIPSGSVQYSQTTASPRNSNNRNQSPHTPSFRSGSGFLKHRKKTGSAICWWYTTRRLSLYMNDSLFIFING